MKTSKLLKGDLLGILPGLLNALSGFFRRLLGAPYVFFACFRLYWASCDDIYAPKPFDHLHRLINALFWAVFASFLSISLSVFLGIWGNLGAAHL